MIKDKTTVLVIGNFNILHPGHLRLFRFARECGDRLIVAVNSDQKAGRAAHLPEALRLEGVKSNQWVDEAFVTDGSDAEIAKALKPDIVVKGKEYENGVNPELSVLEEYGGRLLFSSGETVFSSLDLIRREFSDFDPRSIRMPQEFMARHDIPASRLVELLINFPKLKVCVVGDLIVDEYITCQPLGMSQEDPTVVVTPIDSTRFVGGGRNCCSTCGGFGSGSKFCVCNRRGFLTRVCFG